jgi:excisionase family DNA binding protein
MDLLTKRELAKFLSISPKTIDRWVSEREIPFLRIGRLVRFEYDEIVAWLDGRRIAVAA